MQTSQATQPSVTGRLEALKARHAKLSQRLESIQKKPAVSDIDLREMKRQKLLLKDEIEREQQNH